jgi:hypothetical protein
VVAADGSGVVDAHQLARLGVAPGAHLSVVPVDTPSSPTRRRSLWYLAETDAGRLSTPALTAVASSRGGDRHRCFGRHADRPLVVTHTTRAVSPDQLTAIIELLADPTSPLDAIPIDTSVTAPSRRSPPAAAGPVDRPITATARALGVPLVTKDS